MTKKEVKEETPEVKELNFYDKREKAIFAYNKRRSFNKNDMSWHIFKFAFDDGVLFTKSRCDAHWKSVIQQKDREIAELNKIIETYI